MKSLHLSENDQPRAVELADRVGETLARSGVVTAYRLSADRWEITPGTKVGVVQVGETAVWIRPKLPVYRILFLLGFAKNPGWSTEDVTLGEVDDLLPALAGAFVDQAEHALETGLLQGYVEVDDTLTVLRGRLRDQEQLRRRFGLAVPLLVRFDDHTTDIAENRLLRSAVDRLLRLPGVDGKTRIRLRGLRQVLGDITLIPRGARLPSWSPTRLNARYHVSLWLAELILGDNAVDQTPGGTRINGFLVDMARVFEDFVTAAMTRDLERIGGRCAAQDRRHLDTRDRVVVKPDLVWYLHGAPAAVLDAKYKAEKPAGFPDADLYQMLAYCTALDLDEGHLIYAKGNEPETSHEVRNVGVTIRAHAPGPGTAPARAARPCAIPRHPCRCRCVTRSDENCRVATATGTEPRWVQAAAIDWTRGVSTSLQLPHPIEPSVGRQPITSRPSRDRR